MSDTAKRALLVDFDGVLRVWPPTREALGIAEAEIRLVAFAPTLLAQVVRGAIHDEAWREEIIARLSERYGESVARDAVTRWSGAFGIVVPEVAGLLRRVAPTISLVLATNATSRLSGDLKKLGLSDMFYALANSSELGVAKPEPEFFEAALRLVGVAAQNALFVDDTMENVNSAAALGIRSHRFQSASLMEAFLLQHHALAEA